MALGKKVARSIPKKKQGARDLSLNLLADTYHTADLLKNRPRNRLNIAWMVTSGTVSIECTE